MLIYILQQNVAFLSSSSLPSPVYSQPLMTLLLLFLHLEHHFSTLSLSYSELQCLLHLWLSVFMYVCMHVYKYACIYLGIFVHSVVLLFEKSICKSQVGKRCWLRAPGFMGQSLETPLLVFIPLVYIYSTCFTPLDLPLFLPTFPLLLPWFFIFFALIHTFYSYPECSPSSGPHLQCLFIFQTNSGMICKTASAHSLFSLQAFLWMLLPAPMHHFSIYNMALGWDSYLPMISLCHCKLLNGKGHFLRIPSLLSQPNYFFLSVQFHQHTTYMVHSDIFVK